MCAKYIAASGIVLSTTGAICFAFEAIKVFRKTSFEIKSISYRGQATAIKTPEFVKYDEARIFWMWVGLGLTVFGNIVQMVALFLV